MQGAATSMQNTEPARVKYTHINAEHTKKKSHMDQHDFVDECVELLRAAAPAVRIRDAVYRKHAHQHPTVRHADDLLRRLTSELQNVTKQLSEMCTELADLHSRTEPVVRDPAVDHLVAWISSVVSGNTTARDAFTREESYTELTDERVCKSALDKFHGQVNGHFAAYKFPHETYVIAITGYGANRGNFYFYIDMHQKKGCSYTATEFMDIKAFNEKLYRLKMITHEPARVIYDRVQRPNRRDNGNPDTV